MEQDRFTATQVMLLFAGSVALMVFTSVSVLAIGIAGVIVVQVTSIAGVSVVAARLRFGPRAWAVLGLGRPPGRSLVGAVLVGAGFWFINLLLSAPLVEWVGGDEEIEALGTLISEAPLWLAALSIVVAPALCEEILLRGVVARSLAARWGPVLAIVVSAALFSLFHFSLPRLLPTALLGLLLAYATLQAGSIWPSVLMHAVNNAVALALSAELLPPLADAMMEQPLVCLLASLTLCATGMSLLRNMQQRSK